MYADVHTCQIIDGNYHCVYAFTQAHMCICTHTIPNYRWIPSQHPALRHFSSGLSYKIARETNGCL